MSCKSTFSVKETQGTSDFLKGHIENAPCILVGGRRWSPLSTGGSSTDAHRGRGRVHISPTMAAATYPSRVLTVSASPSAPCLLELEKYTLNSPRLLIDRLPAPSCKDTSCKQVFSSPFNSSSNGQEDSCYPNPQHPRGLSLHVQIHVQIGFL